MLFGLREIFGCSTAYGHLGKKVSNYCNTATLGDNRRVTERYTHTSVHTLSGHYLGCDTGEVKLVQQSAGLLTNLREVLLQSIEAFASRLV